MWPRCRTMNGWHAYLVVSLAIAGAVPIQAQENEDRSPRINLVLLDDGAGTLSEGAKLARNRWDEWRKRLPTFVDMIDLVATFRTASGAGPTAESSLYAIEISSGVGADEIEAFTARELERIQEATKRPSVVLARSSSGTDQLRLVFQDSHDYKPLDAAKFLRVFREISPPIPLRAIADNFGPFQPPPTIIFDPRICVARTGDAEHDGRQRWGVLEDTYLLPHYVLHAIATLNEMCRDGGGTFYAESVPEPGTLSSVRILVASQGLLNQATVMVAGGKNTSVLGADQFLRAPSPASLTRETIITVQADPVQLGQVIDRLGSRPLQIIAAGFDGTQAAVTTLKNREVSPARDIKLNVVDYASHAGLNSVLKDFGDRLYLTAHDLGELGKRPGIAVSAFQTKSPLNIGPTRDLRSHGILVAEAQQHQAKSVPFLPSLPLGENIKLPLPVSVKPSLIDNGVSPVVWKTGQGDVLKVSATSSQMFSTLGKGLNVRPVSPAVPEPGGVLFERGYSYKLDIQGDVRKTVAKAKGAVEKNDGNESAFEENGRTIAVASINVGGGTNEHRFKLRWFSGI